MERWRGRVAIVTGASAGIGATICQRFAAEHGMKVVGVARRLDRIQKLASETKGELHAIQGDVSKEEDVIRIVKWTRDNLGGVDVLVNSAGVLHNSTLLDGKTEDWRQLYDVNVIGLSMFTREAVKDMRDRKVDDGHIIHINSIMGHHFLPFPTMYMYSASKHSVTMLSEALRRELKDLGLHIRITSVSPGLCKTEILNASGFISSGAETETFFKQHPSLTPTNVSEAVEYALGAPPSVNIEEINLRVTCASD